MTCADCGLDISCDRNRIRVQCCHREFVCVRREKGSRVLTATCCARKHAAHKPLCNVRAHIRCHSDDAEIWTWPGVGYVCKSHRAMLEEKTASKASCAADAGTPLLPPLSHLRIIPDRETVLDLFFDVVLEVMNVHALREAGAERPWSDDPLIHFLHIECPADEKDCTSKLVSSGLDKVVAAMHGKDEESVVGALVVAAASARRFNSRAWVVEILQSLAARPHILE